MPTSDDIKDAFDAVKRLVAKEFPPGTLRHEQAIDRATTTFLNAIPKFRPCPDKPNSLTAFALACVERSFPKIHAKSNDSPLSLDTDRDSQKHVPPTQSIEWDLLPPPLQDVCWLRSQGFNFVDTALLLGLSHQAARKRLEAAQAILRA